LNTLNNKNIKEINFKFKENSDEKFIKKIKEDKQEEKTNFFKKNQNDNIILKTKDDLNLINYKKEFKDKNIIESPKNNLSLDENQEFNDLFDDNICEIKEKDSTNNLNHNVDYNNNLQKNQIENIIENNEMKPKNSMKIKLNLDLNTVELNSKFVYYNSNDNQINESQIEEENENLFDEYEEEKVDYNYENDQSQIENEMMEMEDNNDNFCENYDENEDTCVVREKSTIITIPNLNFINDQNFDKIKIDDNKNKSTVEKNEIERAIKSSNSDNQKDVKSNNNCNF